MIGVVLLSADGYYVGENGQLPARPWFDKNLLLAIVKGNVCLASPNTLAGLPKSILAAAKEVTTEAKDVTVNLGIATFRSNPPDLLLVVRSEYFLGKGKRFDLTWLTATYTCVSDSIHANDSVSIWLRKETTQLELEL